MNWTTLPLNIFLYNAYFYENWTPYVVFWTSKVTHFYVKNVILTILRCFFGKNQNRNPPSNWKKGRVTVQNFSKKSIFWPYGIKIGTFFRRATLVRSILRSIFGLLRKLLELFWWIFFQNTPQTMLFKKEWRFFVVKFIVSSINDKNRFSAVFWPPSLFFGH